MRQIILFDLPFWTPLIPPVGIASIKAKLKSHGILSITFDANTDQQYKSIYQSYFNTIKEIIPEKNHGNFYSIGTDVFRSHLMAYLNKTQNSDYYELVKLLIKLIYNYDVSDNMVEKLDSLVSQFYSWEKQYISDKINQYEPEFVGISVKKDTLPASIFAFETIKKINPSIKTIMGGPIFSEQLSISSPSFEFFKNKTKNYIDAYIVGPGEELILSYINNELEDKKVFQINDFKRKENLSKENYFPDYSDYRIEQYPYMGIVGSTGCHYNCTFCNVVKYFGKYNQKNVGIIVDEMEQLHNNYGSQLFFFCDNMVNPYVSELTDEIIRRKLSLYWSAYFRVELKAKNLDEVVKWRKGGMYHLRIGVDSGSQRILDLMDKNFNVEDSKIMLMNLALCGIKSTVYWLIGHPGETEEDFQKTLDYLTEMKDFIWETECEYYNYYYSGQSGSDKWANERELLFPEKYKNLLWIDKWIVKGEPSWEVIFDRVRRFVLHCKELGIPNPYSISELKKADERWKILHDKSVPSIIDFMSKTNIINDNINFSNISTVVSNRADSMDFEF